MNLFTNLQNWLRGETPQRAEHERFLANYQFPPGLKQRFAQSHPALDLASCDQVFEGLRTYFWVCGRAHNQGMASMPSQIVDEAWHEFILWTREYSIFCEQAFAFFLHHTPAQAMSSPTQAQEGVRRTWRLACLHDGIDPQNPQRLPLLFALDAQLNIPNGFNYSLDCRAKPQRRDDFCASHIESSSDSSDGGDSGSNSDSSQSSASSHSLHASHSGHSNSHHDSNVHSDAGQSDFGHADASHSDSGNSGASDSGASDSGAGDASSCGGDSGGCGGGCGGD